MQILGTSNVRQFLLASLFILLGTLGLAVYQFSLPRLTPTHTITVGKATFAVTKALTSAEQEQGLSRVAYLAPNQGMLFIFPQASRYAFWMKGMRFALDMIWIENEKVVAITANAEPASYPSIIQPPTPVHQVLEVRAGTVAREGITVGSTVHE